MSNKKFYFEGRIIMNDIQKEIEECKNFAKNLNMNGENNFTTNFSILKILNILEMINNKIIS